MGTKCGIMGETIMQPVTQEYRDSLEVLTVELIGQSDVRAIQRLINNAVPFRVTHRDGHAQMNVVGLMRPYGLNLKVVNGLISEATIRN